MLDRSRSQASRSLGRHELLSRTLRDWDGDDAGRCRILLLTSGLGLGHVRAAQAIEAALERRCVATVHTLDFWSLMNAGVAQAVHATYLSLVQNYPQLYERLYTSTSTPGARSWRASPARRPRCSKCWS